MTPVSATYEILACKVLNRSVDKHWVDWAVEMIEAGFDSENLIILAGENPPYNQFELKELTDKVLNDLYLDYSDRDRTIKNYVCHIVDKALSGQTDTFKVLEIIKDLCIEIGYERYLMDFYLLYFTKTDLLYDDCQYHWTASSVDRSNIDQVILDYFKKWLADNSLGRLLEIIV